MFADEETGCTCYDETTRRCPVHTPPSPSTSEKVVPIRTQGEGPKRNAMLDNIRATYELGLSIIEKKNHDYGADADPFRNFRTAGVLGLTVEKAILVRVLDKLARVNNLLEHDAYVTEESMEDTLVDAINYLAILKAYRNLTKEAHGTAA
jgi:hypothetical protein